MDEVKKIEKLLLEAKEAYYQGEAKLTDEEFDKLEARLAELDPGNEVLQSVGFLAAKGPKKKLPEIMLSQEKALDEVSAVHIMKRFKTGINPRTGEFYKYIVTPKLDGAGISLTYNNGKLVEAISRGDWEYGTDLMPIIDELKGIRKTIIEKSLVIIRGEMIFSKMNFYEVLKSQMARGIDKYSNARNAVAALLNPLAKGDNLIYRERISLVTYDLFRSGGINETYHLGTENIYTYEERLRTLKRFGMGPVSYVALVPHKGTLPESIIPEVMKELEKSQENSLYECDGVVVRANDTVYGRELGRTQHHWKQSFAVKPLPETVEARVTGLDWSLSKIGTLTPVVLIEPVKVGGAVISRVNGHNLDQLELLNIAPGTRVDIVRSGGVIPKIVGSDKGATEELASDAWRAEIPTKDPNSGSPTYIKELSEGGGKVLAVVVGDSPYVAAKKVDSFLHELGVLGLGSGILEEFMVNADLTSIREFLMENINNVKCYSDHISSRGVGTNYNKKLRDGVLDRLRQAVTRAEILVAMGIPKCKSAVLNKSKYFDLHSEEEGEIKEKYADSLRGEVTTPGIREEVLSWWNDNAEEVIDVMKLFSAIVYTNSPLLGGAEEGAVEESAQPLSGKIFVITGALSKPRKTIEFIITAAGGKIGSSVSKNTDYLLKGEGEDGSAKHRKALELGVNIISEQEFEELLG